MKRRETQRFPYFGNARARDDRVIQRVCLRRGWYSRHFISPYFIVVPPARFQRRTRASRMRPGGYWEEGRVNLSREVDNGSRPAPRRRPPCTDVVCVTSWAFRGDEVASGSIAHAAVVVAAHLRDGACIPRRISERLPI